ncbi:MAG: lycopene cyclase family protein [Acidobacteriota bacterium]
MNPVQATGERFDIVILGGGLAGLSLAWRLVDGLGPTRRIAIVEPRETYRADRTWCFWNLESHRFEHLVDRRWHRWRVAGSWGELERGSQRQPYERVPAEAFYGAALDLLADSSNVELVLGARAERVAEQDGEVSVTTSAGELTASLVFDSRPPSSRSGALEQRFAGWQVRSENPCFDPRAVTLMDFQEDPRAEGLHFFYVLPDSLFEALVEDTWIAPEGAPEPIHEDHLRRYLEVRYGLTEFEIVRRESGAIPMDPGLARRPVRGRVLPLGTRGGAVRPATGYAFLQIQRQCDRLAQQLLRRSDELPEISMPSPISGLDRWMDTLFLAYLRRHPRRMPQLFRALFEHTRPDALSRFLAGGGSFADRWAAMRALPKRPMLGQALRWVTHHG